MKPEDQGRLDELYERLRRESRRSMGYPSNADFDYAPLYRFLEFPLNNIGDPAVPGTYRSGSREFEREVLKFFSELTHAPPGGAWGYVTSGGTEGNLYGLYLARELYPDGMVYCSEDTHYSVSKSLGVLDMRHIMIKTTRGGQIDLEDFAETVRIHRDVPPIVMANVGTTMKEAVDDIPAIRRILKGMAITRSYLHCDAALSGMILPFIDGAPPFDFAAGADSLSISGHKMLGSPVPCGVVLALKKNVDRVARAVEYVGSLDTTLTGSRSGFAPLVLWLAIRRQGREGFRHMVQGCLDTAAYATQRLRDAGVEAWKNPHAITVVFPAPGPKVVDKWQIAVSEGMAHLLAMPHVTRGMVDELVEDIRSGGSP